MSVFPIQRGNEINDQSDQTRSAEESSRPSDQAIKRESKLTFGGFIYICVTLFLAIGAVNSQNNLLFWLFGVAIATIIVSGLFSGNALMRTRLRARVLQEVHAGQSQRLVYTVKNRSVFFPLFACLVSEEGKARDGDQHMPASIVHIGPGESTRVSGVFTPEHRGRYVFRKIRLSTRFPFGLLQKSLLFEHARPLLVLPHELNLRKDLTKPLPSSGEEVLRKSQRGGMSNEFWGLREYRPGDPTRRISWKHSARRGELVVVEQAESFAMQIWIVVVEPDNVGQADWDIHTERAIAIAASLIKNASKNSRPIGLWYPQRGVTYSPTTGRAQSGRIIKSLAMLDLDEPAKPFQHVPIRTRDRVIVIQRGSKTAQVGAAARVIDTERPREWLTDGSLLPSGLGGER